MITITPKMLRQLIRESFRRLRVNDTTASDEERKLVAQERGPNKGSVAKGLVGMESAIAEEIDELRSSPEFRDLDSFISYKLDNDEVTYNFIELQALARNMASKRVGRKVDGADKLDIDGVRNDLEKEMGFKYIPREPIKQVRGTSSPAHGTSPFAGMGGGGSGFGTDFGTPHVGGFTGFGGGPGAIGGKYDWDPNDPKNLGMGAKKRPGR